MEKPTRVQLKLRRRRRFFRFLLFLFILSMILLFMFRSPIFNIKTYNVEGNYKLANEDIISKSSINIGDNIFKINKSLALENISTLSYIKNIQIKRKLPSSIEFNIEERIGALQTKTDLSMYLIDIEGQVLEELEILNENLPEITGFDLNNIVIGQNLFLESEKQEIVQFIQDSNEVNFLGKTSKIDMSDLDNININLNNGISVAFGTIDNVKYKLSLLNEILIDIEKKELQIKMIIMNKGDNPILVIDDKSEG